MTTQPRKKPRQMLIVGTMLLAMAAIIGVLFSRTASIPNSDSSGSNSDPVNFHTRMSYSLSPGPGDGVTGSGDMKSETRKLAPYSAIESDGAVDIKWSPGPAPSAVVNAQATILPHIKTEVVDGTLKISTDSITTTGAMTVTLTGPQINRVDLSGAGDFSASALAGDNIEVKASGSSDLHFDGNVHHFTIEIDGSGDVAAGDLKTGSTDITITGSGDAQVNATDSLSADISGSGDVTYRGKPLQVAQNISGSGTVESK